MNKENEPHAGRNTLYSESQKLGMLFIDPYCSLSHGHIEAETHGAYDQWYRLHSLDLFLCSDHLSLQVLHLILDVLFLAMPGTVQGRLRAGDVFDQVLWAACTCYH